jgi:hypothetical protein
MEDFLSMDNILSGDEAATLFADFTEEEAPEQTEEKKAEKEETKETTEVNPDELFEEEPESVGSGKEDKKSEENTPSKKDGTSPNFYSSIASALKEEGVFSAPSDEEIEKINSAEDFRDLVERQIQSGLEERQ